MSVEKITKVGGRMIENNRRVRFNKEAITIDIQVESNYVYDINLEKCTNAAGLLDWLLQVHGKTWCTPDLFHEVLECLDDVAWLLFDDSLQGIMCPFGEIKTVDWRKKLISEGDAQ